MKITELSSSHPFSPGENCGTFPTPCLWGKCSCFQCLNRCFLPKKKKKKGEWVSWKESTRQISKLVSCEIRSGLKCENMRWEHSLIQTSLPTAHFFNSKKKKKDTHISVQAWKSKNCARLNASVRNQRLICQWNLKHVLVQRHQDQAKTHSNSF